MRAVALMAVAVLLGAAGPRTHGLRLRIPEPPSLPVPTPPRPPLRPRTVFEPAPLPNRDINAPTAQNSNDPQFSPKLFRPGDTYRGEGFSPGSTAEGEQEKNTRPAAGFDIRMPFTPQ